LRYVDSSPEVIRLVVMMYVRLPLSLRDIKDLLAEPGIDICHETMRLSGKLSACRATIAGGGFSPAKWRASLVATWVAAACA
jgi:putative transposase